uniref:Acetylcholinesterase n=1 Tax=Parastrongyloides trichosuri TaxID=131310 RepID=A0A0N4Z2X4_PARTI
MIFKSLSLLVLVFHIIVCDLKEEVKTKHGTIKGKKLTVNDIEVFQYTGIPYAKPPTGDRRFGKPQSLDESNENIDATKPARSCMQGLIDVGYESKYFNDSQHNQSEDCLQLNIWVPKNSNKRVLVFIHGGGFRFGSSSLDIYNGSVLAANTGLIIVTINYRLGIFGFGYMSKGDNMTGNMGLLDQQMALQWVNQNIDKFGGDSKRITLWGYGSGAISASAHLFSKESEAYFQKLILMSGSINSLLGFINKEFVDGTTRLASLKLNCNKHKHKEIFDCMYNKSLTDIVNASEKVVTKINMPTTMGFNIIPEDQVFFKGSLFDKIKRGDMKYYVDVLFGMPNNSGSFFLPALWGRNHFGCEYSQIFNYTDKTCKLNETNYNDFFKYIKVPLKLNESSVEKMKNKYKSSDNDYRSSATKFLTDASIRCRLIDFARDINIKTHGTFYGYYFDSFKTKDNFPEWMASTHGDELYYAFGVPLRKKVLNKRRNLEMELSTKMMDMIKNFTELNNFYPKWEKFTDSYRRGFSIDLQFDPVNDPVIIDDMETDECKELLPLLHKHLYAL